MFQITIRRPVQFQNFSKMKQLIFDWKTFDGASVKPKRLKLTSYTDGISHCPVRNYEQQGFLSQRGCRKHVKKSHGWFYYFDERPETQISEKRKGQLLQVRQNLENEKDAKDTECFTRTVTENVPSLSKDTYFGKEFSQWLQIQLVGGSLRVNPIRLCREHLNFCVLV